MFSIIGGEIGGLLAFIGVFITAIFGLWLLRNQASTVMANLRQQVIHGKAPLSTVAEGLSMLIGSILMLVPGYVTDGIGLLLFVPRLRSIIGIAIMGYLLKNARFRAFASTKGTNFNNRAEEPQWSGQQRDGNIIIEGEAKEKYSKASDLPGKTNHP